jgi:hypothetical protein
MRASAAQNHPTSRTNGEPLPPPLLLLLLLLLLVLAC